MSSTVPLGPLGQTTVSDLTEIHSVILMLEPIVPDSYHSKYHQCFRIYLPTAILE